MGFIRAIVVFLLGAGVAAGVYISGIAYQFPSYVAYARHYLASGRHDLAGDGHGPIEPVRRELQFARSELPPVTIAPMAMLVSTSAGGAGDLSCPPSYRVYNNTVRPVLLSLAQDGLRADGRPASPEIRLAPGTALLPEEQNEIANRDLDKVKRRNDCPSPVIRIELKDY